MATTDTGDGLTDAEQQFFATGDASVLQNGLGQDDEAPPVVQEAPEPPEVVAEPEPTPAELALEQARAHAADLERQLTEARAPKAPAEEPLPDPVTDPLGHMTALLNQIKGNYTKLETKLQEERQRADMRQQYDEFTTNVRAIKEDFAKTHPDFDSAYAHLRGIRIADLVETAGVTRNEAIRRINQDELQLSANALERGKNPAELVYNMAKRYGYAAQAPAAPSKAETSAQQQAEAKVARLNNGQFASKAPARSAPPAKGDVTIEGLKDASEKDLNNVVTDDKMWAQIVGGKAGGDIFHH